MGGRLGSRTRESDLVLVHEYRILYSSVADRSSRERRRLSRSQTTSAFLPAVYALLHCSKPNQDGAVDLGQHQSPLLLVARFSASRCVAAGETLASGSHPANACSCPFRLCR